MRDDPVIIIGAGIGGLGAAYWLRQEGLGVQVLEASHRPGGRLMTMERDGDRFDVGAQFVHSNYANALALIDAAGLSAMKRHISGDTQYRLADGSTYEFGHNVRYMPLLGVRGHADFLAFLLRYVVFGKKFEMYRIARDIPAYDETMLSEVLRSEAFTNYVAKPICWGQTQCNPEDTTLYHFIHQLRLTIMTEYIGLAGGMASLCEALAREIGVEYDTPAQHVVHERGRVAGVALADGSVRRARHVIVAVTPDAAARLLPPELEDQREFLGAFDHVAIPMPVFFLDRPLRQDVWSYFTDPTLDRTFMMALDLSAKMPDAVPSGKAIVSAWAQYPKSVAVMEQPAEEVMKRALDDLEFLIPGFASSVEDATLIRHDFGTARYGRGGYGRILRFQRAAEQLRGVSFVSSAYGGTHIEASLLTARRAVERAAVGF